MHSIELDQHEHLSVLNCINVDRGYIPNFYILKSTYFFLDYIANYEAGAVMGMQPNAWMTRWLFGSWISDFIECLKKGPGEDLTNRHLLILDGHNSHVIVKVVKISMESGLDIVSLPSHTSHALQPLGIAYFKPFKTAFRKLKDMWLLTNKTRIVDKQTLYEWTLQALKVALTPNIIKEGFKGTSIWPLDRQATRVAMKPSQGFIYVEDARAKGGMIGPAGFGDDKGTDRTGHLVLDAVVVIAYPGHPMPNGPSH